MGLYASNRIGAYGASFASSALLAANTAQQVFAPAANVRGAWIVAAAARSGNSTSNGEIALIAKTSAPTTVVDGDVLAGVDCMMQQGTPASFVVTAKLQSRIFVPAGKGLYWISNIAEGAGTRSVLYTLL